MFRAGALRDDLRRGRGRQQWPAGCRPAAGPSRGTRWTSGEHSQPRCRGSTSR